MANNTSVNELNDEAWKEQQEKVAKYLADFFNPEKWKLMTFKTSAPKDTRTFETYYR